MFHDFDSVYQTVLSVFSILDAELDRAFKVPQHSRLVILLLYLFRFENLDIENGSNVDKLVVGDLER